MIIKNEINSLYYKKGKDYNLDYSNINDSIERYKNVENLDEYLSEMKVKADDKIKFLRIEDVLDKEEIENIDYKRINSWIDDYSSISSNSEYYDKAQRRIKEFVIEYNKKAPDYLKKEIKKESPQIGMTKEEILNYSWGQPKDINKTTTKNGTHEQWVYSGNRYLYFDNDKLTGIQE